MSAATPHVGVAGLGTYLPEGRLSAEQIAEASGLPAWVVRDKLGVASKTDPGPHDHPAAMGTWAAQRALEDAGVDAADVDVVVSITEEYKEYPVWTAGIKMAYDLGASRAWAFDVGQKCGTSVLALKLARDLITADDRVSVVLVAGGYRNGDLIDYRDPNVRFMYALGAGGGAMVVRRGAGHAILRSHIVTDGSFSLDVRVPVGGTVEPVTADNAHRFRLEVPDPGGMKARLEERSLATFRDVITAAAADAGAEPADIRHLAMLHVKPSAHAWLLNELGLGEDRSLYLGDVGHLGQVDQILSLERARAAGRLQDGDLAVLVAAGVGYVWNALALRWSDPAPGGRR
ncbi:MAG: 3-oxoacyl-ACP synthase [Trueperaceae bacterium]|nr:3-oxoacyl-ACP synthase [Trueperaceae bacterium]